MSSREVETLATVPAGIEIEIVRDLLAGDSRRADARLRAGARWRCRRNGSVTVLLTSRSGQRLSVSQDEARFVQVRRTADSN